MKKLYALIGALLTVILLLCVALIFSLRTRRPVQIDVGGKGGKGLSSMFVFRDDVTVQINSSRTITELRPTDSNYRTIYPVRGEFLVCNVTITNSSDQALNINDLMMVLDDGDLIFSSSPPPRLSYIGFNRTPENIPARSSVSGEILFDGPPGTKPGEIKYDSGKRQF